MLEFRYWLPDQARQKYNRLLTAGFSCNMSVDGRGVLVRFVL